MSTRSGKRIHSSLQVDTDIIDAQITRSERKTRSKHTKENVDVANASPKVKTRHYVTYPSSDETAAEDGTDDKKNTRVLRRNALKERNLPSSTEGAEPDTRKSVRSTRKTRRFAENPEDPNTQDEQKPKKKKDVGKKVGVPKKKSKKKKSRGSGSMVVENIVPEAASTLNNSNTSVDSFHSAAGSPRNTAIDVPSNILDPVLLIDTAIDQKINTPEIIKSRSAGNLDSTLTNNDATDKGSRRKSSVKAISSAKMNKVSLNNSIKDTEECKNTTLDVKSNLNCSTRKSFGNATFDKTITPHKADTTFEIHEKPSSGMKIKSFTDETFDVNDDLKSDEVIPVNITFEKEASLKSGKKTRRQSAVNAMLKMTKMSSPVSDRVINANQKLTLNKVDVEAAEENKEAVNNESPRKSIVDTTFDKDSDTESVEDKNSTVNCTLNVESSANEVPSPIKMDENELNCKSVINTTYAEETDKESKVSTTLYKKVTETNNTTFDQETSETKIKNMRKSIPLLPIQKLPDSNVITDLENKLDNTYDKVSKSSIISSDNSIISLDKSNGSKISLTSDESLNDQNLLSITPVLIESSLDESQISHDKTPPNTDTIAPVTPLKREGTFTKDEADVDPLKISQDKTPHKPKHIASMTPLKREGTFTKDKPEAKLITPTKRMSLPSPGFTPFNVNKSTTKEKKSMLMNVTRSIEKSQQPLVANPSRATKVMFCSPVNNPALLLQNERKVVKSNLKGSNKSFVFDRSITLDSRPVNRKRSYTQSDAEDARVKRKRLADSTQQSVDRLSRPRTSSASAKLAEPTPKKPTTPRKADVKPARTKLPNFSALHQKQFDKMESLNECQSRRARRAKLLLTPTGGVDMLQRISPKDKSELENPKEPSEPSKDTKKPETPIKSLPPLKSLNSGYTRFGFKLNLDVNPFSIPGKTHTRPKENKPNGAETKGINSKKSLPSKPSLSGATSRKEIAKQTVMREKSFTDRRNMKRTENLTENRTVIKGVRTNRRFELQMRMRDI